MIVPVALGVGAYALATQPHAQRHELTVGTTGSSTEPCSETTLSADEIYDRLRAGAQHGAIEHARTEIQQLAAKYAERLAEVERLTSELGDSWVGAAADSATRYSVPAVDALRSSGARLDGCAVAHGPLDRQADAYAAVLRDVVPLPATPPESGVVNTLNPFETDTDRAITKYNDAAARNIAAYVTYYTASGENGRAMPYEFPAPPTGSAPSIVVVPPPGGAGADPRPAYVPVPAVAADSGPPPTAAASAGFPVAGNPALPPLAYDVPGGTAAQGWSTEASKPVPAGPTAIASPGPGSAGVSGGGVGALFSQPGGGSAPRGSGSALRGPGGAVDSGPRGQGGVDPRGRGGVAGVPRVESGGVLGSGGPGGAAGRRGKDSDEDEEHKTKYLEDEDLGKQWGDTGPVAPPVIGDTR